MNKPDYEARKHAFGISTHPETVQKLIDSWLAGYQARELEDGWVKMNSGIYPDRDADVLVWLSVGVALTAKRINDDWYVCFSNGEKFLSEEGIIATHWKRISPPNSKL